MTRDRGELAPHQELGDRAGQVGQVEPQRGVLRGKVRHLGSDEHLHILLYGRTVREARMHTATVQSTAAHSMRSTH
ncbi:hypothetical protein B8W69_13785 [Mycobacterium vulneris]|uniref:Uncharacterized protein n=1 Tax=Mycolicibacterium vulneris TaxID=547163 RepID=A0A1X2L143_9MYCO|nr:hypothetical protein B8W69_13785 [Mycolicibacterium vulneris]